MKMHTCTQLVFFVFCTSQLIAQSNLGTVTAKVLDPDQSPLLYANVKLNLLADSSLAKVAITDDNGIFRMDHISPGRYWIEISYVGLPTLKIDGIAIQDGIAIDLGVLQVEEAAGADLEEVVVKGERPLVELEDDKMIFNVDKSINAVGNNGLELLRKAPGGLVDNNNNITLLGRAGIRIFIDGRQSPLQGNDLVNYLQSLQSTDIDAIEIITNPGSKYEAEGNAGIINIRLKKDQSLGANANLNLGYRVGLRSHYNGGLSSNFRTRKINLFGNYSYSRNNPVSFIRMIREQYDHRIQLFSDWSDVWKSNNIKTGLDLYLSEKSTLGFVFDGNISNRENDSFNRAWLSSNSQSEVDSVLHAKTGFITHNENMNFNLNYLFQPSEGEQLSIDLNYGVFKSDHDEPQSNFYFDPTETTELSGKLTQIIAPRDIDIYAAKVDYERSLGKGRLGAGGKISYVLTDNNFQFLHILGQQPVLDINRSNDFVYEEHINAAYVNYSGPITDKVNYQFGLRMEQTNSTGELTALVPTENDLVKRTYLDFFPSASLNIQANEKNQVQLSYSRRINRPSYQNLNPFAFAGDEVTIRRGNPFLRPEYANSFQLRHSYNYRINTTLAFNHTTDVMLFQLQAGENKVSELVWINLADQYHYSINVATPMTVTPWWSSFLSLTGYYQQNKGYFGDDGAIDVDVKALNIYGQQTFKLPKDISIELSGWYNTPGVFGGNMQIESMWAMDLGLQKTLLGGNANVKLAVSNIFMTSNIHGHSEFGALSSIFHARFGDTRRFTVNFTCLLGNQQVKKTRQRNMGTEDENKRL